MERIQTLYGLNIIGVIALSVINLGIQIHYSYEEYDGLDDGSFTRVMSVWLIPIISYCVGSVCSYTASKIARRQEVVTYAYERGMMMNEMNAIHLGCLCMWSALTIARMIRPEDFNLILIIIETLTLVSYEVAFLLLLHQLSKYFEREQLDIELH